MIRTDNLSLWHLDGLWKFFVSSFFLKISTEERSSALQTSILHWKCSTRSLRRQNQVLIVGFFIVSNMFSVRLPLASMRVNSALRVFVAKLLLLEDRKEIKFMLEETGYTTFFNFNDTFIATHIERTGLSSRVASMTSFSNSTTK